MRLVLMHVHDDGIGDAHEEALFTVPGGERTAIAAPFAALDRMVAILADSLADTPPQRCPSCGECPATPPMPPLPPSPPSLR